MSSKLDLIWLDIEIVKINIALNLKKASSIN